MNILWTALLMGLMGGFHCVGMCGPIALSLPVHPDAGRWKYVRGRVFYNLGRVLTYTLLGFLFGIFGLSLNLSGLQQSVSIISGLLILLLQFAPGNLSGKVARLLGLPRLVSAIKRSFATFFHKKSMGALLIIGMLNGLLPCGFVYLALAGSLSATSIASAGLYMAMFGLGTFPIMLPLSLSGKMISFSLKHHIQKAVPYIATAIAILFILRGLSLNIPYISPELHGGKEAVSVCH